MTLEQFIEPIHNITRIRIVKGKGSRYETSEADVYITEWETAEPDSQQPQEH